MKKDKILFSGKLLKVSLRKKRLPNGYMGHFEMITHPGAALIVPFISKDKIIMLRQLRPVIGEYLYELPAGTLGAGEKPLACAKREIIEETGYKARKFSLMGSIYPVPGYSTEKIFIYKAEGLTEVERIPEEDEVIETMVFTKNGIKKLFKEGKIRDAKTISALAFVEWI